MSAPAESAKGLTGGLAAFEEYEDPALAWIDLVAAMKSSDPTVPRACLQLAKQSKWTHHQWEIAQELSEEFDDEDWQPHEIKPDGEEQDYEQHDDRDWDGPGELTATQKLRQLKQAEIDDFFEE